MSYSSSRLEKFIFCNQVVIFTTTQRPSSTELSSFLKSIGFSSYNITVVILNKHTGLNQELIVRTGMRTVPVIFIDGKLIGGFSNLKASYNIGSRKYGRTDERLKELF